jgi:dynein heavy chain
MLLKSELHALLVGPTGTGKTCYITKYIRQLSID